MTVRQVIQEIEALPPEEQREVLGHFSELRLESPAKKPAIRYLTREEARPMIKEILAEHSVLFRKLAE